jgi:hypothetical protein
MKMKKIIAIATIATLAGCAQMAWYKPGATQQSFSQDKYDCLQQSQQRVATYNPNNANWGGNTYTNSQQTNNTLFQSCMNARGYSLQRQN